MKQKVKKMKRKDILIQLEKHLQNANFSLCSDVVISNKEISEAMVLVARLQEMEKTKARKEASKVATEARTTKAKEKIQNAINILRIEDKKITYYSIAKTAGVSYSTVKKYISLNEINSF